MSNTARNEKGSATDDKEDIAIATADPFATWLHTTRHARGLTQRQLGLPPGTIGGYESGRRHPKTFAQCERLAQALEVEVDAVINVLGETSASPLPIVYRLIHEGRWAEAYTRIQTIQLHAYRTGHTRTLTEADRLLTCVAPKVRTDPGRHLAVTNPVQTLDWAALAFRNQQWISAMALLEALHHTLSEHSEFRGRLFNNLAVVSQALGHLEQAVEWARRYIAWANAHHDAWRRVIASALALLHQTMLDPNDGAIPDYLQTLDQWRIPDSGQIDPLVACWAMDAHARVALAQQDLKSAHRCLAIYTHYLDQHAACRGEALRLADVRAQLLQLEERPAEAATLLRTVLRQPQHRNDPVYSRLEVAQTVARCEHRVAVWRQLIQAYWSLGAKGWVARLLAEWSNVDPAATIDLPPLLLPSGDA